MWKDEETGYIIDDSYDLNFTIRSGGAIEHYVFYKLDGEPTVHGDSKALYALSKYIFECAQKARDEARKNYLVEQMAGL